jgi:hypothetical protein
VKKIILAIALSGFTSSVFAQSRPDSAQLPCATVAGIVQREGAVIVGTGPYTYDRYVRDESVCYANQILKPAWVLSRDQAQCFIGYTCREHERNGARG